MDALADRAVDAYHRLLRDESALTVELEERFIDRLTGAQMTFDGRPLCLCPRPNFISRPAYESMRGTCRSIFGAIEKLEARLGPALYDRVGITPEERPMVEIDPGFPHSAPLARLDAFLTRETHQYVELNAETPAGPAYNHLLTEIFLELPVIERFQEQFTLRPFASLDRLLDTLIGCYRASGGTAMAPMIAVVDYDEVPTRTEHYLCRDFFERRGYPSLVCDPRTLEYSGGCLRHDGRAIDIVYKRLLVNEFLERVEELQALMKAVTERAVTMVNPFRCKPLHKKAIFAVLTDDALAGELEPAEREAIARHVPWTRMVREERTEKAGGSIDLPPFIRDHREHLVLKPNDEYGGKGVFIGWEMGQGAWERALEIALAEPYVVQQRIELNRQTFPAIDPTLDFRELIMDLDPFIYNGEVEGFLTRLSESSLANVTSGGGQVPSFLIEPR